MKVFKYKFSKLIISLIYTCIAICVAGIAINIYFIATGDISESANIVYPIIQYALTFLIPILLLILLISLLLSSYYSIDEKTLTTSFGIIKSKYDINDIQRIILDRTTNKLAVYLKNNVLFFIVVKEEWYEDFIDTLCKANPKIEYTIQSKENDVDKDEKQN